MILGLMFAALYKLAPKRYLLITLEDCRSKNPDLYDTAIELLGIDGWPYLLWVQGTEYVQAGGLRAHPKSVGMEDAYFTDAAGRDQTPGPIKDAVDQVRVASAEMLADPTLKGAKEKLLKQVLRPILGKDKRLASQLDEDDLYQETLLRLKEAIDAPWVHWDLGGDWSKTRLRDPIRLMQGVVQNLTARKYGTNKAIERLQADEDETTLQNRSAQADFDSVESRMMLQQINDELPPKQKEALEIQLQAVRQGFSLEEMARQRGRDPRQVRNNWKAVQRKFRGKQNPEDRTKA